MQPAYFFYRPGEPSDITADYVRGKKQKMEPTDVTLMSGEVVVIDCPAGTDLTLTGHADKPLSRAQLIGLKGMPDPEEPVSVKDTVVQWTFFDVRSEKNFELKMTDTNGVVGSRKFKIRPIRDAEPSVDVTIADWVRKTKEGYMVTPNARIPFSGPIKDDRGLARVNYAYTVSVVESSAIVDVKALCGSMGIGIPAADNAGLNTTIFLGHAIHEYDRVKNAPAIESKDIRYYPTDKENPKWPDSVGRFKERLQARAATEYVMKSRMDSLLGQPQKADFLRKDGLLRDFTLSADSMNEFKIDRDPFNSDFDLRVAKLQAAPEKAQVRYRVMLWVEAADTDLDSTRARDGVDGPKVSTSKERYPLIIVPPEDLLVEIAKDEGKLAIDMNNLVEKLDVIEKGLGNITLDLNGKPKAEQLSPMVVRTMTMEESLDTQQAALKEVLMKYKMLFREMKGNNNGDSDDKLKKKLRDTLEKIIKPLDDIDTFEFKDAKQKLGDLRKELDYKGGDLDDAVRRSTKASVAARDQMQKLLDQLRAIIQNMEDEIKLGDIIEKLRSNEKDLERIYDIIKHIRDIREQQLLDEALKGLDKKP
jgi:hypothetical protein